MCFSRAFSVHELQILIMHDIYYVSEIERNDDK